MKYTVILAAVIAAALHISSACAQETGYRDFTGRVDGRPMPLPDTADADIPEWQSPGEFAAGIRDDMAVPPAVSMTSLIGVGRRETPRQRTVMVVPANNTLRIWKINISNGSAANWGSFPDSYLDARTLSFPTP